MNGDCFRSVILAYCIKVPVLAVIRASDKLRCGGVLTRDSFNRTTSESNDKDNAESKGNVRNDRSSHR